MTSTAAQERTALVALLERVGPDAPTLCEGWTTHDLAAHLVVRERSPYAVPGLVLRPLRRVTAALEDRARRQSYDALLTQLRDGPPVWSPGGALRGPLAGLTDVHEMFVHHEDVRRLVDPAPRALPADVDRDVWRRVRLMGPALAARVGRLAVSVATPDGRRAGVHAVPGSRDGVLLVGEPGELLLWLFGRRAAAHVEVHGSPEARERALTAPLGW